MNVVSLEIDCIVGFTVGLRLIRSEVHNLVHNFFLLPGARDSEHRPERSELFTVHDGRGDAHPVLL